MDHGPLPHEWCEAFAAQERRTRLDWRRLLDPAYEPARTERGRRLRELRRRVVESGEELLSLDEIRRFLGRGTR